MLATGFSLVQGFPTRMKKTTQEHRRGPISPSQPVSPTQPPTPTPTTQIQPTPEWLTYTHPVYRDSVQYPSDWKLYEVKEGPDAEWVEFRPGSTTNRAAVGIMIFPPIATAQTPEEHVIDVIRKAPEGLLVNPKYWAERINNRKWVFLLDEESREPYNSLVALTQHYGKLYNLRVSPYHPRHLTPEMVDAREVFNIMLQSFYLKK